MQQVEANGARRAQRRSAVARAVVLQDRLAAAGVRAALSLRDQQVFAAGIAALARGDGTLDADTADYVAAASRRGLTSSVHLQGDRAFPSEGPELRERLAGLPAKTELIVDARAAHVSLQVHPPAYTWFPASRKFGNWRAGSPGMPAMAAGVRSCCPLLAAEGASTVLPISGLSAPAHSAWLSLSVDLVRFADRRGRVSDRRLKLALDACIEDGDALLEELSWICPSQAADARKNRRLAVSLDGLGDLVVAANEDPTSLACLYRLDRLVADIHRHLWRRSRNLARVHGALPALTDHQPRADWRDDAHRRAWADRWHKAVQEAQVRHRNLLVLSPYSLLPRAGKSHGNFADLLPILAHADALRFSGPNRFRDWCAADIKAFLDRLCAQVQRFNATAFIAASA